MATISKTFGEYLVDYFNGSGATSLKSYLFGYTTEITTDFNTAYQGKNTGKKDNIVCVMTTGGAQRAKLDTFTYWSTTANFYFYVPLNDKDTVVHLLEKFAENESDENVSKSLSATYYATFNYNTPIPGDVILRINGVEVVQIVMMAQISYFDLLLARTDIPYVTIGGSVLKNITSYTAQRSPNTSSTAVIGGKYEEKDIESESITYTFEIVLDVSDTLHADLIKTANGYDTVVTNNVSAAETLSLVKAVIISNIAPVLTGTYHKVASFNANLQLSVPYKRAGFPMMTIVITR